MSVYRWLHHQWMATRGEVAFVAIAVIVIWMLGLSLYAVSGKPAGDVPIIGGDTVKMVPATGDEGFNARVFCEDSLTNVSKAIAPDASGATYEMKRVKGGVSESVVVVLAQTSEMLYAKHFWDEAGVQRSEPAFVDEDVKRCLERKS